MPHLINMPRAAWRRQPTYDIELDSNSPYSSGVVNIISGHLGNSLQSVTGNSITKTGTGSVDPFVFGAGVGSRFGDTSGGTYFTTPVETESINGLSLFWLGSLKDDGVILRDHTNATGTGTFVYRASGNLYIRFAGDNTNTTNISPWPIGDKTIMFTRRNGNIFVFDGVNHLSFGNTGSFELVSPWYFHRNGKVVEGVNATTCLAIIWDKFVDPVGFVENPWQLFKPRPARFILIPSAGGGLFITPSGLEHAQSIDAGVLMQAHLLAANGLSHDQALDASALIQANSLIPAGLEHVQTLDSPILAQSNVIAPATLTHTHSIEAAALELSGILSPAGLAHQQTLDSASVVQAHVITPAGLEHGHELTLAELSQATILIADNLAHLQALASPALSVGLSITPGGLVHVQSLDDATLTQAYILLPSDLAHVQTLSAAQISTGNIYVPAGRVIVIGASDRYLVIMPSDRTILLS